jgi:hypothetical protein
MFDDENTRFVQGKKEYRSKKGKIIRQAFYQFGFPWGITKIYLQLKRKRKRSKSLRDFPKSSMPPFLRRLISVTIIHTLSGFLAGQGRKGSG